MKRRRAAAPPPSTMGILGVCRRLPHKLILEILSRIPAKTLLQFKLVCKSWYNSIQDPVFIKMHINRSMENDHTSVFLASEPSYSMSAGPFDLVSQIYSLEGDSHDKCMEFENPILHKSRVLGSCNGLVCLSNGKVMCLLNPFTREYKMIKVNEEISFRKSVFGLGYDGANDDYILVQLVHTDDCFDFYDFGSDDDMDSGVYVYSLKDTLLCSKIANIPYRRLYAPDLGVYLNGCLHWVATKKQCAPVDIIAFDNTEKVFREMPRPVNLGEGANMTLGLLGGKLSILCDFYQKDSELWVMGKYGVADSWIKLVSMVRGFLPRAPKSRVLCFSENGKLLLKDGKVPILYDPKTKKVWNISYRGIRWYKICKSIVYVPSLISLKSGNYADVVGDQPSKKRKKRNYYYSDEDILSDEGGDEYEYTLPDFFEDFDFAG
ncbi:F-box protein cpr1 [Thalictrum thalictroides]|uniref:F-box protein cpr1 n=1 Tax=Thalictrum thalictroides TaxID=46969 RepID=A0A7J6XGV6_THATH|nr:F-box protein cpr1 [Thalictrum thalictroides]